MSPAAAAALAAAAAAAAAARVHCLSRAHCLIMHFSNELSQNADGRGVGARGDRGREMRRRRLWYRKVIADANEGVTVHLDAAQNV